MKRKEKLTQQFLEITVLSNYDTKYFNFCSQLVKKLRFEYQIIAYTD